VKELPAYEIFINGKPHKIELTKTGEKAFTVKIDGKTVKAELPTEKLDLEENVFPIKIDEKTYAIRLPKIEKGKILPVKVEEATFKAEIKTPVRKAVVTAYEPTVTTPIRRPASVQQPIAEGTVTAPMTGKILSIKVKKGDAVKAGQILCILEAMKMENEITTSKAGTVREVYISEGSSVSEGEPLFLID